MQRLLSGRMKRLFRGAVIVGGLAAANAVIDSPGIADVNPSAGVSKLDYATSVGCCRSAITR